MRSTTIPAVLLPTSYSKLLLLLCTFWCAASATMQVHLSMDTSYHGGVEATGPTFPFIGKASNYRFGSIPIIRSIRLERVFLLSKGDGTWSKGPFTPANLLMWQGRCPIPHLLHQARPCCSTVEHHQGQATSLRLCVHAWVGGFTQRRR